MKKTIKAWACIDSENKIAQKFDHLHNVFAPRVYTLKTGAEKVAEVVITGAERLKVVPCNITYSLQSKGDGI